MSKKIKKRELLKYDYTNNIKVIFDIDYNFYSVNYFKHLSSFNYYKYMFLFDVNIFDISSFVSSLSDKSFLHSISMLEVLFFLCRYYNTDLSFNYNFTFYSLPLSLFESLDDFYDFIFSIYCDLKTKNNFYSFVRSCYKSFYSKHSNISIICINSKNIIIHLKDISSFTISIKNDCLHSSCFFC